MPEAHFASSTAGNLQLLPLRFERLDDHRYLVANLVGDVLMMSAGELDRITSLAVTPGDGLYERAFSKQLITRKGQTSQLQLLGLRLRSRMAFLR
jgi:hypothetical protein